MAPSGNPGIAKSAEHRVRIGEGVKNARRKSRANLEDLARRLNWLLSDFEAQKAESQRSQRDGDSAGRQSADEHYEKLIDEMFERLVEAAAVVADYAGLTVELTREGKPAKSASNGRAAAAPTGFKSLDVLNGEIEALATEPIRRPVRSSGFSTGGSVAGIVPCLEADCHVAVDLSLRPGGYCKNHAAPVRRQFTTPDFEHRNLDEELRSAERRASQLKSDFQEADHRVADLKREIVAYDLVRKLTDDPDV